MTVYEKYGKLMVQAEILQGQIQACKQEIQAELLKKPEVPKEEVKA